MNLFKRKNNIGIQYSILFAIVLMFFGLQFLILGKSMIWSVDGYLQWYPVFAKFKMLIGDLFSHGIAMWQWDTGLGGDLIANYSMILFDPFSYIALLFSKANQDIAYSIIIVLKLYTAGFIVLKYLQSKGKSFNLCLVGAITYAFCSWGIVAIRHDFFVSQLIIFPLIIWGIDKVWNRENPILLTVSIFFSCAISIYFTYMTAILVVIYVIVKYIKEKTEKSFADFIKKAFSLIGYAVLGALMAAPIIASQLYALINTSTESGDGFGKLPNLFSLIRFIPGFSGNVDANLNYSNVALSGILILAVPVILLLRKKTTAMVMSIISAVIVLIPALQSILNGFSYPAGRWCYVAAYFLTIATVESIEVLQEKYDSYRVKFRIYAIIVVVISLVAAGFFVAFDKYQLLSILLNVLFARVIFVIIAKSKNREDGEFKLRWVVVLNVAIICFIVFSPIFIGDVTIYNDHKDNADGYNSSSLAHASKIKDNDFYRVGTFWNPWADANGIAVHTATNANLYWNTPSTFEYLSTLDSDWSKYNVELANSGGNFLRMTSQHNDSRCRINFLQGVKYYLSENLDFRGPHIMQDYVDYDKYVDYGYKKIKLPNTKTHAFESKVKTGLGYVFNSAISKKDYSKLTPVQKEQALMDSVVLEDEDMKDIPEMSKDAKDVDFEKNTKLNFKLLANTKYVKINGNKIKVKRNVDHFLINHEALPDNQELYVVIKNIQRKEFSPKKEIVYREKSGEEIAAGTKWKARLGLNYEDKSDIKLYLSRVCGNKKILKGICNEEKINQGIQDVKDYIVNLGSTNIKSQNIVCTFPTSGKYSFDSIEVLTVPTKEYAKKAKELSKQRLVTTSIKNDEVKGYVDAKKDGMLYLSIIKHDGWKIYVDGKKVDKVYQVDTAFTGVKVKKGHHNIKLVYNVVGWPYTIIMALIGWILFIAIAIVNAKRKKKDRSLR